MEATTANAEEEPPVLGVGLYPCAASRSQMAERHHRNARKEMYYLHGEESFYALVCLGAICEPVHASCKRVTSGLGAYFDGH